MTRRVRAWLTQPGLQFIVIGLALFAIARARQPAPTLAPPTGRVAQLRADFIRQTGVPPQPAEEALLAARALEEELLYREALARGLGAGPAIRFRLAEKVRFFDENDQRDQDSLYREALTLGLDQEDAFVRRSLVERMRLIAQREIPDGPVNDATLQAYLEHHGVQYRQPPRVRITQVFLSRDRHGDSLEKAAASVLAALRSPTPSALDTLGDPFPIGPTGNLMTQHDLEKLFGLEFARRVMDLAPGAWSGPLPSAYGLHLVRVEAREPGGLPSLAAVRNQVERAYRLEQGELAYDAFLGRLRTKYGVEMARGHSVSQPEAAPVAAGGAG
jgi:peptidyl-prolyl cis-trans isomerase C